MKLAAIAPTLATVEHTPMAEFLMRSRDQRSAFIIADHLRDIMDGVEENKINRIPLSLSIFPLVKRDCCSPHNSGEQFRREHVYSSISGSDRSTRDEQLNEGNEFGS